MQVPRKVTLQSKQVRIDWSDGHQSIFSNKNLRDACPCALCAGEGPPLGGGGKVIPLRPALPEDITATKFTMIGRYAIAFTWSDGHSSGIYPYEYLLERCECERCSRVRA